jgi:curved DNA-binding protein CbpA
MNTNTNNKLNYFSDCTTIEQIKKRYRELAQKFHPDKADGNTETMKQINLQYEQFKNKKFTGINHETKKQYEQTFDPFDGYREIIDKIINLAGIQIELCGTWLWVTGVKKDDKGKQAILKELNFKFSGKKIAWYWHAGEYHKKSKKNMTLDDIRNTYGSSTVNKQDKEQEQRQMIA